MTFLRLTRWDWLAFAAALALLLTMSADWYTTEQGEECRRVQRLQTPSGGLQGEEIGSTVRRDARECAEAREKNAFQASALIDRLIMLVLLGAIAAAVVAAFLRAAERRFEPPLTPSAVAAMAGLVGALLILYRILQPPGFNESAVVKAGAPIGLALVGALAVAARFASLAEAEEPEPSADSEAENGSTDEAPESEPQDAEPPPARDEEWAPDWEEEPGGDDVRFEVADEPDEPPKDAPPT